MAAGEALAHLTFLVTAGELTTDFRDDANWYQTK
jgi:hypothetical protein